MSSENKKIAILSDQLAGSLGGAESILLAALDLYPESDLYTTVHREGFLPSPYDAKKVHTTFIQKLPMAVEKYKAYLPLMPLGVELLDLQSYDVLFSSHHSMIKGVIPRPDAYHVCYCHSPARYLWDMFWVYSDLNDFGFFKKLAVSGVSSYLRMWDVTSANRVDRYIANSSFTAQRIKKFYGREANVLYPPVNTTKFQNQGTDDYYLIAGRLVAYKGFEMAIDTFNENGKPLVVIGDGPEFQKLKAKAKPNIKMLGRVDEATLIKCMNECKGFIFPGKEDFGIVMAEAQSAGKPVIALSAGGALDIVENLKTGVLVEEYNVASFVKAIQLADDMTWDSNYIELSTQRFDVEYFKEQLKQYIETPQYI
ncbi:MAG: glycosyltransferase [Vampirovibrionales bacterium]